MNNDQLKVLVVDDDYRVASVHVGYVERIDGFRVVGEAHSATEALSLSDSLKPDVVLMDIYLPDGDGLAVVKQLLLGSSPPAVIMISAANDAETVHAALKLGVVHYLVKPFAFDTLSERLSAIRDVSVHVANFPEEATQEDINALFDTLRAKPSLVEEKIRLPPRTDAATCLCSSRHEQNCDVGIRHCHTSRSQPSDRPAGADPARAKQYHHARVEVWAHRDGPSTATASRQSRAQDHWSG